MSKKPVGFVATLEPIKEVEEDSIATESLPKKDLTNYERLEANKKNVLAFAKEKASVPVEKMNDERCDELVQSGRIDAKKFFEDGIATGDLSAAIKKLDEIKDNRIGIVWHKKSADLGNGTSALVRDARGVTNDLDKLKKDAPEKYAMQILNQTRAAYDLIDKAIITPKGEAASNLNLDGSEPSEEQIREEREAKQVAKNKIAFIAKQAMDNIDSLNSKTIKNYNTLMVYALESSGIDQPDKKLLFAREIANFKDEHHHIVTLTKAKDAKGTDHTVYEAEIMLNGLSNKQKEQYEQIAKCTTKSESVSEDLYKPIGIDWFDIMPVYKQDLLKSVAKDIAEGNKVIPAQLLSDVVGVRNAYQKVTAISGTDKPFKILTVVNTTGMPATKIKTKNPQEIVNENVQQLRSFAPDGHPINLNNFTSKTLGDYRGEDFIGKQISAAAEADPTNIKVSASPLNRWRMGLEEGGRDTKQFEENLRNIGENLINNQGEKRVGLKAVSDYLIEGETGYLNKMSRGNYTPNKAKAMAVLKNLSKSEPELALSLKTAVEARSLIDYSTLSADAENVNLELSSKMARIGYSIKSESGVLRKVVGEDLVKEYPEDFQGCKSNKDRGGEAKQTQSIDAVNEELGVVYKKTGIVQRVFNKLKGDDRYSIGEKNLLNQFAGNHAQEMAGIQGGTSGCHGLKKNFEFKFVRSIRHLANGLLSQKTANYNSKIKIVKNENKKIKLIKEFDKACISNGLPISDKAFEVKSGSMGVGKKIGKGLKKIASRFKTKKPQAEFDNPASKDTKTVKKSGRRGSFHGGL